MADDKLLAMLGYGPNTGGVEPKAETLSTFKMGSLRDIIYESPRVAKDDAPPSEHLRRHPKYKKYKHQLFGLRDYTPYTDRWLIGYDQPALTDFLKRQEQFYNSLTLRDMLILQTYTLFGDRLLNSFLRQTPADIEGVLITILHNDEELTPLDFQIVDRYAELKAAGLWMPPYEDMFLRDANFDHMKEKSELPEELRGHFVGMINRKQCREIISENRWWFSDFDNIKPMLYSLFTEIMDIILRSPRPRAPIKVYRGLGSERQASLHFTAADFWSTSISPDAALDFARGVTRGARSLCCIYEITIHPGVPCMFLDLITRMPGELEILMVPGTIYKSSNVVRQKALYPIVGDKATYVYTTELEATGIDTKSVSYDYLERHWAAQREHSAKLRHKRYKSGKFIGAKSLRRTTAKKERILHSPSVSNALPASYTVSNRHKSRRKSRKDKQTAAGGAGVSANRYVPILETVANVSS